MERVLEFLKQRSAEPLWQDVLRESWGRGGAFDEAANRAWGDYHPALTKERLLEIYRLMVLSRRIDDRELMLQKQGQCWFTISGAGKEAALVAAGMILRKTDPLLPYYRDRALALTRGVSTREMLMAAVAAAADPAGGGRQMPSHFGHKALAIISPSSATGTNVIPASGLAEALAKGRLIPSDLAYPPDSVVYVSVGDATCSEGEVYEGLKSAAVTRAPLVFHLEDDGWGISVPVSEQHPGGDPSRFLGAFPGVRLIKFDGTDLRASWNAFEEGVSHARARRGPVILHGRVTRLYSHSSTDDQEKYRTGGDVRWERERDPIERLARELVGYEIAHPAALLAIHQGVDREVEQAVEEVLRLPKTDTTTFLANTNQYDPARTAEAYARRGVVSEIAGKSVTMAEAIRVCLGELFAADPRFVAFGEDVADFSLENWEHRDKLEGKGGVFGLTRGLQRRFGPERVFNTPIAEASIVGRAIGYALAGFVPIVEVQFRDYLSPAWQQLVDEAATLAYRSNGAFHCPMVVRMAYGNYLGGAGAIWHSESAVGPLMNYPGLRIAVPSNARDAVGMLREAAYSGDVVAFLEPKALYRRRGPFVEGEYPPAEFRVPLGRARLHGAGEDLTIVAYGNTAPMCVEAMERLGRDGIKARMLDLLWLAPLDEGEILRQAAATGRVLIVEEDRRLGGAGATIADVIRQDRELRRTVDIERVAALDVRVSYGPTGERAVVPHLEDVLEGARRLLG
jgi:2-oxoisovalerate dehydrogenase E1 component